MGTRFFAVLIALVSVPAWAVEAPAPHGPVPTERQLAWHRLEFYGFVHFTINTFTGREWGEGSESPQLFNPSQLDTAQWARAARDAGMRALILTAKHHDGFCLWPSELTTHSVKSSPWKNGAGDVVGELAAACRAEGLKMGVYLSPWDRNHAEYGREPYVAYYHQQLRELLTNYGEIGEVWHDGANGGSGYYGGANETRNIDARTYYRFADVWEMTRDLQPQAVIFSDAGPDIRWVGNEHGHAPETCWARIRPAGFYPGIADQARLGTGDPDGTVWRPAEVDVSLRRGWFFHDNEEPKSLVELLDIYYASVGHGCCLLLNLTPDQRGLVPEADVARLREFRSVLDTTFATDLAAGKLASASETRGGDATYAADHLTDSDRDSYWCPNDGTTTCEVTVNLQTPTELNRIRVEEHIALGQRVEAFAIDAHTAAGWETIHQGTTIGARKIVRIPNVTADQVRLRIVRAQACPLITTFELYQATTEPAINP